MKFLPSNKHRHTSSRLTFYSSQPSQKMSHLLAFGLHFTLDKINECESNDLDLLQNATEMNENVEMQMPVPPSN